MSHGHPWSAQRFQCQRNALSCRSGMRQQASLSNASWMSARRSQRIRRRRKPCNQAKLLSTTQRQVPSPVPCRVPRRAIGGHDAAGTDLVPVDVVVVPAVGEQRVRLPARMTDPPADRRDRVEEGQELGNVVAVAAGQQHRERGAVSVSDQVMLGAGSSPVNWRWARVLPPFSALTCEESTTQQDQSRRAAAFSSACRISCNAARRQPRCSPAAGASTSCPTRSRGPWAGTPTGFRCAARTRSRTARPCQATACDRRRLHNEVLDRLGAVGAIDWSAALVDSASVRAKEGPARRAESGRPGQTRRQDPHAD